MGVRLSAVEKPFPHYVPVFDLCIERKVTLSENVYFMYLISNVCFHLHLLLNARVQVYNRKKRAPMKTLVCKWTQKNVRPSVVMSVCKKNTEEDKETHYLLWHCPLYATDKDVDSCRQARFLNWHSLLYVLPSVPQTALWYWSLSYCYFRLFF